MKTEFITVWFSLALFVSGCSTYQKNPVSISNSVDSGKAKVISQSGEEFKYNKIFKEGNAYYGYRKTKKENASGTYVTVEDTIPINSSEVSAVYVQGFRVTVIWIQFKDKTKVNGVIYDVADSSIWVADYIGGESPVYMHAYKNNDFGLNEFKAKDIAFVKLRKANQLGKTASIGALVGGAAGFITGFAVGSTGYESVAAGVLFGAGAGGIGLGIGAIIGSIAGIPKKKYVIENRLTKMQVEELAKYCIE